MITSKKNETIKLIKSLEKKKYQDKYNLFKIEGYKFCKDIYNSNRDIIEYIITTEEYELEFENAITVNNEVFNYISNTKTPQGVLIVLKMETYNKEDIKENENILYLDNVQDPENVGALIRTSVCADFNSIIITDKTASPFSPKAVRSSVGSVLNTKIIIDYNYEVLEYLKDNNYEIIASTLQGEINSSFNKTKNVLIVGNEGQGISDECLKYKTKEVKIPMSGKCESLNASVSGSLLMYKIYGY